MPIHPNARQCAFIKVDGTRCGGPCKDDFDQCFHHQGLKDRFERQRFTIPPLDDQNAVQVAVMEIMNALLAGKISRADSYALFYGLYIAKSNVKGLTLVPPTPDQVAEKIEQAVADAKAEFQADVKKTEDAEPSLAEYLFRALGEASDAAGQAKVNDTLRRLGKPTLDQPGSLHQPDQLGSPDQLDSRSLDKLVSPDQLGSPALDSAPYGAREDAPLIASASCEMRTEKKAG